MSVYENLVNAGVDHIKREMDNGLGIDDKDGRGRTLLHYAAAAGNIAVMDLLLGRGAKADVKDSAGSTPEDYAFDAYHRGVPCRHKIFEVLVDNESFNINEPLMDNWKTLLHFAVDHEDLELLGLLVENGANLEQKDFYGVSPLLYAARNCWFEGVELLLENTAEVNTTGEDGLTPLHAVQEYAGALKWTKMLVRHGANVNAGSRAGTTPLHLAVNRKVAAFLLERGANINAVNRKGETPMHSADAVVAAVLLEKGANVNACAKDGSTPLHSAAWDGDIAAVKVLLDRGAVIEAATNDGEVPLHIAAARGRNDVCRLLLECGAKIQACTRSGETALHRAALNGRLEVVQLLVKSMPDSAGRAALINAVSDSGCTAVDEAVKGQHLEVVKFLREQGDQGAIVDGR